MRHASVNKRIYALILLEKQRYTNTKLLLKNLKGKLGYHRISATKATK